MLTKQEIAAKLEVAHNKIASNKDILDKEIWRTLPVNQNYSDINKRHFLMLKDEQLVQAYRLIKAIKVAKRMVEESEKVADYPYKFPYLFQGYLTNALDNMFYDKIADRTILGETRIHEILAGSKLEATPEGIADWFERNYPRDKFPVDFPINDWNGHWPQLRCLLYSFGSLEIVRVFNNLEY